jgi:hypothetical protein
MGSAASFADSKIIDKYQGLASPQVIRAVQKASARTGVDFAFLMEKASAESSFDPKAKSNSSSATGLYQFISDTWLRLVKNHGAEFGLGQYADQIQMQDGKPTVADAATRHKILNLRNDPEVSALMAGAYSADNKAYLENHTDQDIGGTELSLAHFMGAGGAAKFLNCRACTPDAAAAKLFPHEAHANKGLFYDHATHKPRTLDQIYQFFANKFTGGPSHAQASAHTQAGKDAPVQATDDDNDDEDEAQNASAVSTVSSGSSPVVSSAALANAVGLPVNAADIIWDTPATHQDQQASFGFLRHNDKHFDNSRGNSHKTQRLSPSNIMTIATLNAQAQNPFNYNL